MKHELRVPTKEQYAYINFEFEGTADDAIAEYRRLTLLVKEGNGEFAGPGLSTINFNKAIDGYLTTGKMTADEYAEMNQEQQNIIQCVKRSRARTNK